MVLSISFNRLRREGAIVGTLCAFLTITYASIASAQHAIECDRIVSISPSVTETLYAAGLGNHVVGISKYDTYPPEALKLPVVGGLLDPNLELIVSLKPTLVVGLTEQQDVTQKLSSLGIATLLLEHRSIEGIFESFALLQKRCGDSLENNSALTKIRDELNAIREEAQKLPPRRVVVVVYREYDAPHLKDIYLSGTDGYYGDVLGYVGGKNVFSAVTGNLSAASIEGLIRLDPDVIIEVLPPGLIKEKGEEYLYRAWNDAQLIRAVKEKHLFLLDQDWATIPGPRVTVLAQKFFDLLHR